METRILHTRLTIPLVEENEKQNGHEVDSPPQRGREIEPREGENLPFKEEPWQRTEENEDPKGRLQLEMIGPQLLEPRKK